MKKEPVLICCNGNEKFYHVLPIISCLDQRVFLTAISSRTRILIAQKRNIKFGFVFKSFLSNEKA